MSAEIMLRWSKLLHQIQPRDWIVPPDTMLLIYCGSTDRDKILHICGEQPPESIILYIFPGTIDKEAEIFNIAARANFLPIATQSIGLPSDRIAMAVELLFYKDYQFAIEPGISEQFAELFLELPEKLMQAQFVRKNQNNTRLSRIDAMIGNLALSAYRRMLRLQPTPKSFPAIVCGAGPSLADSLDLLHQYRRKICLISVGHAFKALTANGLRPDAIIEIDPNARKNWGHGIAPREIPLVAGIGVDPGVTAQFRNIVWGNCWEKHEQLWFREAKVPLLRLSGGRTVIIPAMDFARLANFEAIATVGTDMCFSASGQAHANEASKPLEEERFNVPGWDGQSVQTNEMLDTIRKAVEKYLAETPEKTPITNCTARGAVIAGMDHEQLAKWLKEHTGPDATPIFDFNDELTATTGWLRKTSDSFQSYLQKTTDIVNATKPINRPLTQPEISRLERLLAAEKQFPANLYYPINNLQHRIDTLMQSEMLPIHNPAKTEAEELHNLNFRHQLQYRLSCDLMDKINTAADLNNQPAKEKAFTANLYAHDAFLWMAELAVKRSHPALAEYLAQPGITEGHPQFRFTHKWHEIESVIRRNSGDGETVLDPNITFSSIVASHTPPMLAEMKLQDQEGIVFLAPCGWQYVFTILQLEPLRPMIILEPWPELLRQLVHYSLFPTRLPRQTAIIGIDHKLLPDAETALQKQLRTWQQQGIRPRLLVHPQAATIPEIAEPKEWTAAQLQPYQTQSRKEPRRR